MTAIEAIDLSVVLLQSWGALAVEKSTAGAALVAGFRKEPDRIVLAVVCRGPVEAFAQLMKLLDNAWAAEMVRSGLFEIEVLEWSRRPSGGLVVVRHCLGSDDFAAVGTCEPAMRVRDRVSY